MKKFVYRTILLLDYIPRYGRTYRLNEHSDPDSAGSPTWKWQRYGDWGTVALGAYYWVALDLLSQESDTPEPAPVPESNNKR